MRELKEGRKIGIENVGPTIKLPVLGEEGGPHVVTAALHQVLKRVPTE